MDIIVTNPQTGTFNARGICPHCGVASLHIAVGGAHIGAATGSSGQRSNALVQCQSCQGITYIIVFRPHMHAGWDFDQSFPVENPEGRVDKTIPAPVRADFVEALRCRSIKAYKAAVVMCRRALQSSCKHLGAGGQNLLSQIDDLASKGTITKPLQSMAHQIRKLGNAGAHPDDDALGDVTPEDAGDILEFTDQYFEHVYSMPAKMAELLKRRAPAASLAKPPGP